MFYSKLCINFLVLLTHRRSRTNTNAVTTSSICMFRRRHKNILTVSVYSDDRRALSISKLWSVQGIIAKADYRKLLSRKLKSERILAFKTYSSVLSLYTKTDPFILTRQAI